MDQYSSSDEGAFGTARAPEPLNSPPAPLRFPEDNGGESLAEMAERDLEATLQLLVERARYVTGASGAAIALRDGKELVCRASSGPSAPQVGAELKLNSGLTSECVRTRQVLRCNDTESDARVNRENCRALGIRSLMVVPLIRDADVIGIFELMANRVAAFEERDVPILARLSEMTLTSLEHADAAQRALTEIANAKISELSPTETELAEQQGKSEKPLVLDAGRGRSSAVAELPIHGCQGCGFPVSEGRTLCLDCEETEHSEGHFARTNAGAPAFLSQTVAGGEGWLDSHLYTIGTILIIVLTVVLLMLKFR
ncbi:MAG: GAF domain-containing protein [Acidobacteriia bacterium]|nr:GAF domain-containing protein [Terriglobia bacterium]